MVAESVLATRETSWSDAVSQEMHAILLASELVEETTRATRIRLDAVNAGSTKRPNPGRAA